MSNRALMLSMVILGLVFGAGGMWLAERAAPAGLAGADKARVEQTVHDYLLANPEVIPAAMQRLQDRSTGKLIAASRSDIVTPYGSAWIGNPKGDVTLVEYLDYNCTFCRASLPTLDKLVAADPKLKIVFRELPVLAESSRDAARVSLAAAQQGKWKRFHDLLYAAGPVTAQTIAAAAQGAGVDAARLPTDADAQIKSNLVIASKLGMTGTPAWVVGDRVLQGALPLETLQAAIADARAAR